LGRIPDEIVHKVRDHADLVELIGRTVSLKRAGRNYKGLCPFHDEKTPSFNVNPDRGSYYCFGCQEGGDAISFLMKIENLTFVEAVRSLASQAGIEIPETAGGESGSSEPLYAANELVGQCYREALAEDGCPGARYLEARGLDRETVEAFGIGWAPDAWDFATGALRKAGIDTAVGQKAGLLSERRSGGHYDLLRARVIFPIQDARGRIVGFGGRAISDDQQPKYLNTPESPIFRKRQSFYGFPHALESIRKRDRAVVSEGYFDRIALHRAGIAEAVATCGTALTEDHARNLRRRTRNVVLLFDGDAAGVRAVWKALEVLLPAGLRVTAALLPAGDDPDTFLLREGAEALCKLVDEARSAVDLAVEHAVAQGCETPWAKADAVAEVAPLLARVPSAVERSEYCVRLAMAVGTEAQHVEAAVRAAERGEDARDAVPTAPRRDGPEERNLAQIARALVEHPGLAERVPIAELSELVPRGPLAELVSVLIDAAGEERAVSLSDVAERLSPEARSLLQSYTVLEDPPDEQSASRIVDDTVAWFRKRHKRARSRALTEALRRDGNPDLIAEKQRLLTQDAPPTPPPRMGPTV
jgi:DNA primase